MSKKTLEVSLLGQVYKFATDDSDEHIFKAARFIDSLVESIETAGVKDKNKAIILASLQLSSQLIKIEQAYSEVESDIQKFDIWIDRQLAKLSHLS